MSIHQRDIFLSGFSIIISLISTFLIYFNLLSLVAFIIILVGTIIILIISNFQIKIAGLSEKVNQFEMEQKRLVEKLKIHEKLIDIEGRLIALENKNGKTK